jgi:nucleoside-diphosphate-sugar epimerase
MSNTLHVIFGTGPVGCWTARSLREMGKQVRAVNRSGKRPDLMPADVEIFAADVSVPEQAGAAAQGASVVYQALNPPYDQWHSLFPGLQSGAIAGAKRAGARYVSIENLYMYDSSTTIFEDSPVAPRSRKGALRARMSDDLMAAQTRGELRVTALRSSDYYGPGVLGSAFGEMVIGNLVKGKKAQLSGSVGIPHSFAYIEDVGRAAAILGTRDDAVGKVWIAPHATPRTQREMAEEACRVLGIDPQISVISPLMMRLAGLFVPAAREMVEMMYEFTEPFVVDSGRIKKMFGLEPTSIEVGIERTVKWYKGRVGQNSH